jgi:hypothetical protein
MCKPAQITFALVQMGHWLASTCLEPPGHSRPFLVSWSEEQKQSFSTLETQLDPPRVDARATLFHCVALQSPQLPQGGSSQFLFSHAPLKSSDTLQHMLSLY